MGHLNEGRGMQASTVEGIDLLTLRTVLPDQVETVISFVIQKGSESFGCEILPISAVWTLTC